MGMEINIQCASGDPCVPAEDELRHWARAALGQRRGEVTLRITDEEEMRALNRKWRNIDQPTNVLSFPLNDDPGPLGLLGDVVVCAPLVRREATEQDKPVQAHWAHIVVHGVLHLLGYDHIEDEQAAVMEAEETTQLSKLGFPDPYLTGNQPETVQ